MATYTLQEIASIISPNSGVKLHFPDRIIKDFVIDTRRISSANEALFFALAGKGRHGNSFIPAAYQAGIRAFVVDQNHAFETFDDADYLICENPLQELQNIAAQHRKKFNYPVIAITGSNGKTIVKEWLYQILNNTFNIIRSPKSYNSQIGVALSILEMKQEHQLAIIEAGIDQKNEMPRLEEIIKPNIGVFTHLGPAHESNFSSDLEKLNEKLHLFKSVNTLVFHNKYNLNNSLAGYAIPSIISIDSESGSTIQFIKQIIKNNSSEIHLLINNKIVVYEIPFSDPASLENSLSCIGVLLALGLDPINYLDRFKKLEPIEMRLEFKKAINQCELLCDLYNNDLNAVIIALQTADVQRRQNKKILILSDILQSSQNTELIYEKIAQLKRQFKIEKLIGIGKEISKSKNLFDENDAFYESTEAFLKSIELSAFKEHLIILKGARIFKFEKIQELLEDNIQETTLEINLSAISRNLKYFKSLINSETHIMAMVKAYSYGSGSFEIAHLLQNEGVKYLTVAYADEGISLRKKGINIPIMVMNPRVDVLTALLDYQLEPVIYNFRSLQEFIKIFEESGYTQAGIHIELDTGMHRLGFNENEIPELINELKHNKKIRIKSLFSHLTSSDMPEQDQYTLDQINRFIKLSQLIETEINYSFLKHILNTAGIIRFSQYQMDMVRLGIGLYGIDPDPQHSALLEEAMTLKTSISQIHHLKTGDAVSYGRRFVADKEMKIATIPIGYADGYRRDLGNGKAYVLIDGKKAPIVGAVCMDMCMVNLEGIDAKEGDEVILFGPQLSVQILADLLNTIPYEILTGIAHRVKRIYYYE